jgi:hypothetical protein
MAKFDLKKAISEAQADLKPNALMAAVLGASGGGKSSLCGTFGVKTLYIYTSAESHGPIAVGALGESNVVLICIDKYAGENLDPDEAYSFLLEILADTKDYGAVVIDGATEMEYLIRSTKQFKALCLNSSGKHNNFAEPEAVLRMFRPIITSLKELTRKGVHTAITCALDIQAIAEDGEILESKPRLSTYSVAEGILQQFPAYFCIGRMTRGDKRAWRIQFLSGVSKVSKDAAGVIKKTLNFNPRVTGVKAVPDTMPADMSAVIKLLRGEK